MNALFFRQSMLREALSTNASCLSPSILSERNRLILIKLERIYFVIFSGCVRECISYMAYLRLDVSSNTPEARDTQPATDRRVVTSKSMSLIFMTEQSPSDLRSAQVKATWNEGATR